ncbi:hypothetical protein NHH03_03115 [Stieleria sp. TO1_6]|uniref:hypothetical protein n=1 Tax=Stieleria tagensis TaxID=2956795 RepID=UPI00209B92FD|nr:hypothetical protein [Stieleria tagensis]MCO8120714.1 hypothetical protein [Stieleria tagensis]
MKALSLLSLMFVVALVAGCGDEANRTVTDGVDQQAIADYEAELAKVTGQDINDHGE